MAETGPDKPILLDSSMEEISKPITFNSSVDDFDADDEDMPTDEDMPSDESIPSDEDMPSDEEGDIDLSESDESQFEDTALKHSKLDAILNKKLDYDTYTDQLPQRELLPDRVSDVVPRKIPSRQATHSVSSSSEEEDALETILEDERPASDGEIMDMIDEHEEDDDDDFPSDFDDMSDDGEVVELLEDDSESEILKKLTSKKKDKAKPLPVESDSSATVHEISSNVQETSDDSKKVQVVNSVPADLSSPSADADLGDKTEADTGKTGEVIKFIVN
jgi:hypothetical protein